ncbi:GFA family protein [Pseudomonas sp. DTU_2021_1001937_2_SI_NGA_ILE_001]|uniref:GFA family protein n=1 Tax=Pseudomonas sp. DTU_2021_1001937_2_SI_NGA_ILE_001 TaxID=3077589 RepID=UPI0028FC1564|nr:GFA family protein [Pseudomonas sp. DTU_2021_1001937_2_SI_NGA_ILE_001]WNW13921.1 GFA family protein [Pseudomonas sp. DTU_2021_1001937_2_SI_NGA_ILE_001]
MNDHYQGSCLCQSIRYELLSSPRAVSHCHCGQCRKGHGAMFASYGSVPREALRIVVGMENLTAFDSSPTVRRAFCSRCGSTLFWSRTEGEFADWVSVALGTLDTPFTPAKQKHVYVPEGQPWYLEAPHD